MAITLAQAYVQLLPSMRGFTPAMNRETGNLDEAGKQGGKSWGGGFTGATKGALSGLSAAVVGVATTIGGITVGGGFIRATQIEQAKASLTGLGHSAASVSEIMANALASVKNTAYGLGDAVSVAAVLTAAGIKEGSELTSVLKTVADTATISGRSLSDVGDIFSSVAAKGKLQGDDIMRLTSTGIPVLQLLASSLGKTTEQVQSMVKNGEISFPMFAAAMNKGMGGAALASGKTFQGSLANVGAALGRLGQAVMSPALTMLTGIFQDAMPAIDKITAALAPLITQLAARMAPAVDRISKAFFGWISGIDFTKVGGALTAMSSALLPIVGGILALGGTTLAGALGPLGALLPTISGPMGVIVGLVAALLANSPDLRTMLGNAFLFIGQTLKDVGVALGPLAQSLSRVLGALGDALAPLIPILVTFITDGLEWLAAALPKVIPYINDFAHWLEMLVIQAKYGAGAFGDLNTIFQQVGQWVNTNLVPAVRQIAVAFVNDVLPALGKVGQWFATTFGPAIGELGAAFKRAYDVAAPIVQQIVGQLWPKIVQAMPTIIEIFKGLGEAIAAIISIIAGVIKNFVDQVKVFWDEWGYTIMRVVGDAWDFVVNAIAVAVDIIKGIFKTIAAAMKGDWGGAWEAIKTMASDAWDHLTKAMRASFEGFQQIISDVSAKIVTWLTDALKPFTDFGANIVKGIASGIDGAWHFVKQAITDLAQNMPDWAKQVLQINSPAKVMVPVGAAVTEGLALGVDGSPAVDRSMTALMSKVTTRRPDVATSSAGGGSTDPSLLRLHPDDIAAIGAVILAGATSTALTTLSADKWAVSQKRTSPGRTR